MENKKKIEVIFSLFIGAIFISSYAVLSSLQISTSSVSTNNTSASIPLNTIYLNGYSNALIENYTGIVSILVLCNKYFNQTSANITNILTTLEGNNSVSTFYQTQKVFNIDLGQYTPILLYNHLKSVLPSNELSCINLNATAQLTMPQYVNFTLTTGNVGKPEVFPILLPNNTREIYLNVSVPSNSLLVPVDVAVLVYKNGTVYQSSITKSDS
ncbi:MAG: hypothetical protein QXD23_02670 [Candidatus Micrarchaeaceae archaeon]